MQGSEVKVSKMRVVAARSKSCHDKLGSKGGGLSQRPSDDCPILVEVEGPLPLESLGGR